MTDKNRTYFSSHFFDIIIKNNLAFPPFKSYLVCHATVRSKFTSNQLLSHPVNKAARQQKTREKQPEEPGCLRGETDPQTPPACTGQHVREKLLAAPKRRRREMHHLRVRTAGRPQCVKAGKDSVSLVWTNFCVGATLQASVYLDYETHWTEQNTSFVFRDCVGFGAESEIWLAGSNQRLKAGRNSLPGFLPS